MTIFQNLKNEPDFTSTLKVFENALKYNKLNCCRVGIVESYDAETRVAKVNIANKLTLRANPDGSMVTANYAPIYAKVLFFGWKDIGITHPVFVGSEGILLFNDREIESWFINGNINNVAHERAHSKTDAIFISGLLSLPNMIATAMNCLNLFFKDSNIQISPADIVTNTVNTTINSTGSTVINTPDLTVTGNLNVGTGVSAVVPTGSVTLTFSNGILTGVS